MAKGLNLASKRKEPLVCFLICWQKLMSTNKLKQVFIEKKVSINFDFLVILLKSRRCTQLSSQPGACWSRTEVLYCFAEVPNNPVSSLSSKPNKLKQLKALLLRVNCEFIILLYLFFYKTILHSSENFVLNSGVCHFENAAGFGCKSCLWITVISCEVLRVGSASIRPGSYCGTLLLATHRSKLNSRSHHYADAGGEGGGEGRSAGN